MPYATYEDLINRYPALDDIGGSIDINSSHIHYAEVMLNSRLGQYYTLPFSSNNLTAKDLTIDLVYIRYYETVKKEWAATKQKSLDKFIDGLISGDFVMVTTSHDVIQKDSSRSTMWSNTEDYHPIFGVGDIEDMHVSSARLWDEENARV